MLFRADGNHIYAHALLDTGSESNLVSEDIVKSLGLEPLHSPEGKCVYTLNSVLTTVGEVNLRFRKRRTNRNFEARFLVIHKDHSRGFDLLIGWPLIQEHSLLCVNHGSWMDHGLVVSEEAGPSFRSILFYVLTMVRGWIMDR
jgi:hypothetical protein